MMAHASIDAIAMPCQQGETFPDVEDSQTARHSGSGMSIDPTRNGGHQPVSTYHTVELAEHYL